jgi:homoserine dehydrogenase
MKNIRLGLVGYGNIGRGIYDIINRNKKKYNNIGLDITIPKICVNNLDKPRHIIDYGYKPIITNNYRCLTNDNNIDIIVEVMGGLDIPFEILKETQKNKKKFVTANKKLIANKLDYINNDIRFEAAIGGGIPIIDVLNTQYTSDTVTSMKCIINGTTNYILTKMYDENKKYENVILEAQQCGFAEINPYDDVMGYDAQSKLCILAYIMGNHNINTNLMYIKGINDIKAEDIDYAKYTNNNIKLVATYNHNIANNSMTCSVMPTFVSNNNIISSVNNENNIVLIKSIYNSINIMIGKGAGKYPTTLSIVKDILNICNDNNYTYYKNKYITQNYDFNSTFFTRINCYNKSNVLKTITDYCNKDNIRIDTIVPIKKYKKHSFGIIFNNVSFNNINFLMTKLENEKVIEDFHIFNMLK